MARAEHRAQRQRAHDQAVRLSQAMGRTWYVVRTAMGYVIATTRLQATDVVLETHEPAEVAV